MYDQPINPDHPTETTLRRLGQLDGRWWTISRSQKNAKESQYLLVDENWETLFEIQLNNWMRDPDVWPEVLTRVMFEKWFDYELFDMVWDITGRRIKRQFRSIS